MRFRVEVEDASDGVIQKGPVVRDDQGRAGEIAEPVFQPFEHANVKVVGGFVEQEQVGFSEQQARQHEARFLTAAQSSPTLVSGAMPDKPKGASTLAGCTLARSNVEQGFVIGELKVFIGWVGSQG